MKFNYLYGTLMLIVANVITFFVIVGLGYIIAFMLGGL